MTYRLQPVTDETAEHFFELMRQNCAEVGMDFDEYLDGYQLDMDLGQAMLFYHDDALIGAAILSSNEDTRASGLSDLYIIKDQRGAGHGKSLVNSCETLAEHFGQKAMFLICEAKLKPFYKALGYKKDKKDGKHFFMAKPLKP